MPFTKRPLRSLIDRDLPNQNGWGWAEFEKIARLPKEKRPSIKWMSRVYGKAEVTIKNWLERFEEEKS